MVVVTWLQGLKTYLMAAAMVAYEIAGYLLHGTPINWEVVMQAGGLAALRAGIAKGPNR